MLVWEWLDSVQLENHGLNFNIIKKEGSKLQKKNMRASVENPPAICQKKGKINFIYYFILFISWILVTNKIDYQITMNVSVRMIRYCTIRK